MRMFWCVLNLHSHVFCFCTFPFCTFCTLCTRTLYINLCGRNGLMSNGNLHDLGYGFHISRRVAHAHHHCKCYRILLFSFRFLCSVLLLYTVHFISLFISLFFMRFTLMSPTHTHRCDTHLLSAYKTTTSNIIPAPKSIWYIFEWIRKKFFGRSKTIKKEHMKTIRVSLSLFGVIIILLKQSLDIKWTWRVNVIREMEPSDISTSTYVNFASKFLFLRNFRSFIRKFNHIPLKIISKKVNQITLHFSSGYRRAKTASFEFVWW